MAGLGAENTEMIARLSAAAASAPWQIIAMRRLSPRSTTVPATNTSARNGANCASPTKPSDQALCVSAYICHPSITACI
jgi:hypothetical protein